MILHTRRRRRRVTLPLPQRVYIHTRTNKRRFALPYVLMVWYFSIYFVVALSDNDVRSVGRCGCVYIIYTCDAMCEFI